MILIRWYLVSLHEGTHVANAFMMKIFDAVLTYYHQIRTYPSTSANSGRESPHEDGYALFLQGTLGTSEYQYN